jgi:hypothetical protein
MRDAKELSIIPKNTTPEHLPEDPRTPDKCRFLGFSALLF